MADLCLAVWLVKGADLGRLVGLTPCDGCGKGEVEHNETGNNMKNK